MSKADCHLCHQARQEIEKVRDRFDLDVVEIDITTDPSLFETYKERIPLVFIEDRLAFKYRVDQKSLRRKLKRA